MNCLPVCRSAVYSLFLKTSKGDCVRCIMQCQHSVHILLSQTCSTTCTVQYSSISTHGAPFCYLLTYGAILWRAGVQFYFPVCMHTWNVILISADLPWYSLVCIYEMLISCLRYFYTTCRHSVLFSLWRHVCSSNLLPIVSYTDRKCSEQTCCGTAEDTDCYILNKGLQGWCPEAEFLDEIQTKVFRVFFLAIHSNLYTQQLCLEIFISSNSRNLLKFLQFS